MSHATSQGKNLLHGFKRLTRFEKGLGAQLPEAYKKFWQEWKLTQPAAVHYIPKEQEWERDEITGNIKPVQDIPIPLIDPPESHKGIWGGEAVIQGFQKRKQLKRRVPHFWVPVLKRSVVHSKVLGEYITLVVTERTLDKIHECHGFDHYLLKNPACDLRSSLALKLKRRILVELQHGCPAHEDQPQQQKSLLAEYTRYLEGYTPEAIEWYGYTYNEAIRKLQAKMRAENTVVPHKVEFRVKLLEELKNANIPEALNASGSGEKTLDDKNADVEAMTKLESTSNKSWLSKINPFGKSTN